MPRAKSTNGAPKRKASEVREDCERRFLDAYGRAWTDVDRGRILEDIGLHPPLRAEPSRPTLMFLALRDGVEVATGNPADHGKPLTDLQIAVLSFLLGVRTPQVAEQSKTAAALLDNERATFAKLRAPTIKKFEAATFLHKDRLAWAMRAVKLEEQDKIKSATDDERWEDVSRLALRFDAFVKRST